MVKIKKEIRQYLKKYIILDILLEFICIAILTITRRVLGYTATYRGILWSMLVIIIVGLFGALYLTYELQRKIEIKKLYKLDSYVGIAIFRNCYISIALILIIIILGNIGIKLFTNIDVSIFNDWMMGSAALIGAYCAITIIYEIFNSIIKDFLGTRLDILSTTALIVLISLSKNSNFANALWIISGIGLVNWLSSKESILYYARNDLKNSKYPKKISISDKDIAEWSKRRATALFLTMALAISNSLVVTIPDMYKEKGLKFLYDFYYALISVYDSMTGEKIVADRNYANMDLVGYIMFLFMLCILFLVIQNIANNGRIKFFNLNWKIPYIYDAVEKQKKLAEEALKKDGCDFDKDLGRVENKLDTLTTLVEKQNRYFEKKRSRHRRR